MVEPRKATSTDSTRIKFQSIFEPLDPEQRRTKIICTIAGGSKPKDMINLLDAGMNVASFNFTTGDQRVSPPLLLLTFFSNMERQLIRSEKP